jgi:hypothetical protein
VLPLHPTLGKSIHFLSRELFVKKIISFLLFLSLNLSFLSVHAGPGGSCARRGRDGLTFDDLSDHVILQVMSELLLGEEIKFPEYISGKICIISSIEYFIDHYGEIKSSANGGFAGERYSRLLSCDNLDWSRSQDVNIIVWLFSQYAEQRNTNKLYVLPSVLTDEYLEQLNSKYILSPSYTHEEYSPLVLAKLIIQKCWDDDHVSGEPDTMWGEGFLRASVSGSVHNIYDSYKRLLRTTREAGRRGGHAIFTQALLELFSLSNVMWASADRREWIDVKREIEEQAESGKTICLSTVSAKSAEEVIALQRALTNSRFSQSVTLLEMFYLSASLIHLCELPNIQGLYMHYDAGPEHLVLVDLSELAELRWIDMEGLSNVKKIVLREFPNLRRMKIGSCGDLRNLKLVDHKNLRAISIDGCIFDVTIVLSCLPMLNSLYVTPRSLSSSILRIILCDVRKLEPHHIETGDFVSVEIVDSTES